MDLRQLRALVAVADHASFSAAARSLHTVQSNVSTHIARLERELGVILVERSTGKLTVEGEAVVERARRIEAELQAIDADLASNAGEVRGVVRMGVIGTTARWLVPALLRELSARYPRVQLIVIDATTTQPSDNYLAPGKATPKLGYGYFIWLLPAPRRQFALLGANGQCICVDPASKLIMVQTAVENTNEVWHLWPALVEQFGQG